MAAAPPPAVARYAGQVAGVARRMLGGNLTAAYLHGSAVLGGFAPERSDVDMLLVVAGSVPRPTLESLAFALSRDRLRSPACGLELDLLTEAAVSRPERPTPFELVIDSGASGHRVTLGSDHGPYADGVLHMSLARAAGWPLVGPPPRELISPIPRDMVLAQLVDELDWAAGDASTAYQALGGARAWMYAEADRIGSKIEAAQWARGRGHDAVLQAAVDFQQGRTDDLPEPGAVRRLMADARAALAAARR
jgi:Domain of unknown function (DUF4111)